MSETKSDSILLVVVFRFTIKVKVYPINVFQNEYFCVKCIHPSMHIFVAGPLQWFNPIIQNQIQITNIQIKLQNKKSKVYKSKSIL